MQLSQRFRKNERLCSRYLIEKLFKEGSSFLVFPIRVTYFQIEGREIARLKSPLQVMFSVSKKRFKKSVQRNRIKRLMRECWRINKSPLTEKINKHEKHTKSFFRHRVNSRPDARPEQRIKELS
jgi:ribonuclease P protein component